MNNYNGTLRLYKTDYFKVIPISIFLVWALQIIVRCICSFLSGTIGHVAHGKSTLVKALSGVQVIVLSLVYLFPRMTTRDMFLNKFIWEKIT